LEWTGFLVIKSYTVSTSSSCCQLLFFFWLPEYQLSLLSIRGR